MLTFILNSPLHSISLAEILPVETFNASSPVFIPSTLILPVLVVILVAAVADAVEMAALEAIGQERLEGF